MSTTRRFEFSCHACQHRWSRLIDPNDAAKDIPPCRKCGSKLISWTTQDIVSEEPKGDYEEINHPDHYNQHPSGIECIDVIEHMSFPIGNTIKHLWRAGLKPGMDHHKDLMKAHWYLTRELQRIERESRGSEAGVKISQEMHDKGIMDLYGGK